MGADYCYKVPVLKKRYEEMKEAAHDTGMKFIAAKTACVLWATALLAAGLTDWRVPCQPMQHKSLRFGGL